ncbi:Putative membrane protein (fragment) [Staphylococcus capitis]
MNNVNHNQPIYQGGITAYHDGKLVDYEFLCGC